MGVMFPEFKYTC